MARASRARTLQGLASRMRARASAVPEAGNRAKKETAKAIIQRLIFNSPADTSQTLSNWRVAGTSVIVEPIPAYVPGRDGDTADASASAAWSNESALIDATAKPGVDIVISNVVPWIGDLNAPGGTYKREPNWIQHDIEIGKIMAAQILRKKGGFF